VSTRTDARRRTIRTAVQATISAASVLLVAVPVILAVAEEHLSAGRFAALAGVAAAVTGFATVLTRVMALPAVTGWIDTYLPWLSANERPAEHIESAEFDGFEG
jgi:hypothetical protein